MATSHDERLRANIKAFSDANERVLGRLERLQDDVAHRAPPGGWSAAQIGWHVAATSDWFADVLSGTGALQAKPGRSDFEDGKFGPAVVPKAIAPGVLVPPAAAKRDDAIGRLRASGVRLRPAIAGLTAERGARDCVTLPWATISLYQVCEWASGHALLHLGQMERVLVQVEPASG
jgi:hypothetical protein